MGLTGLPYIYNVAWVMSPREANLVHQAVMTVMVEMATLVHFFLTASESMMQDPSGFYDAETICSLDYIWSL